jgi:hypothetical protein
VPTGPGGSGASLTVTVPQLSGGFVERPFDEMVTLPVFVPAVPYVFTIVCDVPERESVPLHEYVYVPFPPDGDALHVALCPVVIDDGVTEHEPVTGPPVIVVLSVAEAAPCAPLHVTINVAGDVSGSERVFPEIAPPVENPGPEPVQDVALVEDHESVATPPEGTLDDVVSVAVGADEAPTVTVVLSVTVLPSVPIHEIENVVFVVRIPDVSLPDVAPPVENPVPPVAVHDVVFVEVHERVDVCP